MVDLLEDKSWQKGYLVFQADPDSGFCRLVFECEQLFEYMENLKSRNHVVKLFVLHNFYFHDIKRFIS